MVEAKDILNWCFTIAALNFGVFGFLYATYANALLEVTEDRPLPPPIVKYLRRFCRAVAGIQVVLTTLAAVNSYGTGATVSTWIIVGCFVVLTGFTVGLALRMG